ncbi:MAG: urate hydroxylase PuuD [Flaviaesturariibacter sp.]|nr:urate hydroxylase PuuD [Flaviaesturariibacter sp.]
MLNITVYIILGIILFMLLRLTYLFPELNDNASEDEEKKEKLSLFNGLVYAAIVVTIVALLAHTYFIVKDSPWEGHLMEWLNIVVRLMHITFGIAWIGASFYFVFLENALNRTKDVREELAGNLWAVHGGGFYYLEKYKVAPQTIPKDLHWFKYEAYFTWLSGFSLLFVVYYFNAKAFLVDTNVLNLMPIAAVSIGVGSFIIAWIVYHLLCKTSLIRKGVWFTLVGFAIAVGFAYFYCHVFSARAAYIHFGAMLGTLMAGNVFFIIIPAQKAMVKAAKNKTLLDPALGKFAGLRSLHNNYFTLPVLFVMVSNHFPSTFGYSNPWLMLGIMTLGTAGVKHYLNLKEKGQLNVWVLPISVLILLGAAFISAPAKNPGECKETISMAEVNAIVQKRCTTCHSTKPTDDVFTAPPNGVVYETPQDIVRLKDKIMQRVVVTKTMPQNNKTGMTDEERKMVRCWIEQGANLK